MPKVGKARSTGSRTEPIARPRGQAATPAGSRRELRVEAGASEPHVGTDEDDDDDEEFGMDGDEDAENTARITVVAHPQCLPSQNRTRALLGTFSG